MPENFFGEDVAERYDEFSADMFDPAVVEPVVDLLAELAGDGATLELGIGTGRIALPLAQRGVRVHGIDLSEAMVGASENSEPRTILEIADCADRIQLEFDVDSETRRANSLHKLDTLITAIRVFRAGLEAEFAEYDRRERELEELKSE